ncbi:MAG: hypothetical protein OFPII_08000 [Osedax symbiont Rs1]|nr:MAG: hypothetical protein OFPII_08000 [Osedax symbiont Rs1]
MTDALTHKFVIKAAATGVLVIWRKPLAQSTNFSVRPVGWINIS